MLARDMQTLGRLPLLRSLTLLNVRDCMYTICSGEFQNLIYFSTHMEIRCGGEGALPMLEEFEWKASVERAVRLVPGNMPLITWHMWSAKKGNMPLLKKGTYFLQCSYRSREEIEEMVVALRLVAKTHPNRPTLTIQRWGDEFCSDDDRYEKVFFADEEENGENEDGGSEVEILGADQESDNDGTNEISHITINEAATTSQT